MYSFININEIMIDASCREKLRTLCDLYMQHRFDLLGSGFVKLDYNICVERLHGKRYKSRSMARYGMTAAKKLRSRYGEMLGYEPINWFVDYKSGFFFEPGSYNSVKKCRTVISDRAAVDIKCPWELGRLYHLVQMAVFAVADQEYRNDIIREFKNE